MAESKVFISLVDTESLTGRRNTLLPPGVLQHGDVALIDDLRWGDGNRFLGSVVGTTRYIAKQTRWWMCNLIQWIERTR